MIRLEEEKIRLEADIKVLQLKLGNLQAKVFEAKLYPKMLHLCQEIAERKKY